MFCYYSAEYAQRSLCFWSQLHTFASHSRTRISDLCESSNCIGNVLCDIMFAWTRCYEFSFLLGVIFSGKNMNIKYEWSKLQKSQRGIQIFTFYYAFEYFVVFIVTTGNFCCIFELTLRWFSWALFRVLTYVENEQKIRTETHLWVISTRRRNFVHGRMYELSLSPQLVSYDFFL